MSTMSGQHGGLGRLGGEWVAGMPRSLRLLHADQGAGVGTPCAGLPCLFGVAYMLYSTIVTPWAATSDFGRPKYRARIAS